MTIAVETAHNGDADTETAAAVARDRRQPRRWPRPAKHGRRLPRHPDHRDGNELTGEAPRSTPCALRPPIGEQRTFRRLDLAQRHWLGWGSGSARCSEPRYQITGDNCRSCLSAGQSFDVRHDGGWWDLLPESRSPWRPVSVREPFDALLEHAPPETHAAADGGFDAELECCVLTGCDWFRKFDRSTLPTPHRRLSCGSSEPSRIWAAGSQVCRCPHCAWSPRRLVPHRGPLSTVCSPR